MSTDEIKHKTLTGCIEALIMEFREAISSAIREMEKFNISPADFRKESFNLNVAAFALGYLNKIKEVSEKSDYQTTENCIRFHKHQLETKGTGEVGTIKEAQDRTISVLSTIMELCLDK